jgi:predicted tellurium resistance membrane protein TerC
MIENITTLLFLILLQAVLGFDNLLYISLESKKAPNHQQGNSRKIIFTIIFYGNTRKISLF